MGLSLEIPLAVAGLSDMKSPDGSVHYWPNMMFIECTSMTVIGGHQLRP
jgi:hypothetical protein